MPATTYTEATLHADCDISYISWVTFWCHDHNTLGVQ